MTETVRNSSKRGSGEWRNIRLSPDPRDVISGSYRKRNWEVFWLYSQTARHKTTIDEIIQRVVAPGQPMRHALRGK